MIRKARWSGSRSASRTAPVVTVQNHYNIVNRADDALVDRCAAENAANLTLPPDAIAGLDAIGH